MEIFDRLDVPASPYNTIGTLIDDPHLRAVGMVREEDHPTEGPTWAIGAPNRFSGGMAPPRAPAPRLGADGAAVLADAGLSNDEIDTLRRNGVLIEETP
jgi:crotonobetainyl-CoA:carnitine CoA-transferase CaiB-like acyl-CoA transferase